MKTNDPRENSFSATKFRDGVNFAMQMGIPDTASERVTFFWNPQNTYTDQDTRSAPYDWTDSPTSTVSAPDVVASLTVPVAIEFFDSKSSSGDTPVGDFNIGRLKLTILDDAYAKIQDVNLGSPDGLRVDGDEYDIDYWAPPQGLFDVTVYALYASARDES